MRGSRLTTSPWSRSIAPGNRNEHTARAQVTPPSRSSPESPLCARAVGWCAVAPPSRRHRSLFNRDRRAEDLREPLGASCFSARRRGRRLIAVRLASAPSRSGFGSGTRRQSRWGPTAGSRRPRSGGCGDRRRRTPELHQLCERVRQTVLSGELVPGAVVSPISSHSSTTFPVRRWVNAVVESPRRSDWRPAPHRASKAWRIAACLEEAAACSWLLQEDPPVAGGVVAQLFDRADEPLYALGDERAVKGLAWDLPPWPAAR